MAPLFGAARIDGDHTCPAFAHLGGPILAPCSTNVRVNGLAAARATDRAVCNGPPDFIVTGAASVRVNGVPIARVGSKTLHGGAVVEGSADVRIGGSSAGATFGDKQAAKKACEAMAAGRNPPQGAVYPPGDQRAGKQIPPHTPGQSYNNCAIESCRILLHQRGIRVGQEELLDDAIRHHDAEGAFRPREGGRIMEVERDPDPRRLYESGSATPFDTENLLERHGVSSSWSLQSMQGIAQALAERRGVITSHNASDLWGRPDISGGHAIVVSAVTFDAEGRIARVTTVDTGIGSCERELSAADFEDSFRVPAVMTSTDEPVW
jgi:uncharacterized Zn-binding protein involved in type VI secretion